VVVVATLVPDAVPKLFFALTVNVYEVLEVNPVAV
jgi:hypothetical protein